MSNIFIKITTILQLFMQIQGIVFGIIFIKEYKNAKHIFFLGSLIMVYSLGDISTLVTNLGLPQKYPFLILLPTDTSWLLSPLLYVYLQNIPELKEERKDYIGLYLGIFLTVISLIIFFLPLSIKIRISSSIIYSLFSLLDIIFSGVFVLISLLYVINKKKKLGQEYYQTDLSEFRWAYNFTLLLTFSLVAFYLFFIILFIFHIFFKFNLELITAFATIVDLIFQYVIIIYGLKHKYFRSINGRQLFVKSKKNILEFKSETEIQEYQEIIEALNEYLERTEKFKKYDFSILDASIAINIHSKKISAALNSVNSQNFNNYINRFRIEAAKKMLLNLSPSKELEIS
ncbi:hypothetical protein QM480_14035 [Flectobacillus sp. DC10W]|uniref:HTH araC/xylS-type domain-containing protein n=1 Tax=Flectobacillus longus TaxID=2984207 RepID=A0ABT6YPE5_9BACT|nr:hypothetical protein [Flectobacillus longus]MDI9865457.1 hypothetical protein [Flectobacillus longus]